jgi:hypothetical protein
MAGQLLVAYVILDQCMTLLSVPYKKWKYVLQIFIFIYYTESTEINLMDCGDDSIPV